MNWEFILKYLPMYEKAAWLTLRIGLLGIVFAIIVGFVCSTIQYYKVPVLRQIVAVYIETQQKYTIAGTVILYLLWTSEDRNPDKCGGMWCCRTCIFRWKLHGRGFSKRIGSNRTDSDGECVQSWHEPLPDHAVHHFTTGNVRQRSGICGKCDFPFEGNERVQCDQPDGSDVYCKRPDRSLLQDNREFVPACGFLSDPTIADFHFGQSAGKEAALCRIWGLRFY